MTEPVDTALRPATKNARHQQIVDLVTQHEVRSQGELATMLAEQGVSVTQATLSRDLLELDAVKIRAASGALVYAVPAEGGDRRPAAPGETAAGQARLAQALRRAARLGRGQRQPGRAAHPSRRRPVPRLRLRQGRAARGPRHHRRRRHRPGHRPRPGRRRRPRPPLPADFRLHEPNGHPHEQGPHRAAQGRARRHRVLRRPRHLRRGGLDARPGRGPVHLHRRHRAVRRARHLRRTGPRPRVRRRDRPRHRLQDPAGGGGAGRARVRRLPHPLRRPRVLQHHAARPGRHRHHAGARHARGRRRHLGRRVDVQGQRHRAVLPLRPARQPRAADLQAVAGRRLRARARRPRGDEPVADRARAALPRQPGEGVLHRRQHLGRHPRGQDPRAPRRVPGGRSSRSWA